MIRAPRSARRVLRPRYDGNSIPTSSKRWLRASRRIHSSVMEVMETRQLLAATLDTSFNGTGTALADFNQADDYAYSTHVFGDGSTLVAGYATGGSTGADFAVARFNADGTLDSSFGNGGLARHNFGAQEVANSMVVDAGGKIVLAGTSSNGGFDFVVARLNSDGSLDTSFGAGGRTKIDFSFGFDQAYSVAVHNGGYVVAGSANFQFALARLNGDGSLDSGFGTNGRVSTELAPLGSEAFTLTVRADGTILAGGYAYLDDGTESNVALVQYTADGEVDTSFGSFGVAIHDFGGFDDAARGLAIGADGKLYVAGHSQEDILVARFESDGGLDASFGDSGAVRAGFEFESDSAFKLILDSAGSVFVAGHVSESNDRDFAVLKLTSGGELDESFGPDGMFRHDFGSNNDSAQALAFDADGNLVVAGFAAPSGPSDFAVLRLALAVPNEPPVANAGGPYSVKEGSKIKLSGAASTDPESGMLKYEWDFDGDGMVDAEGVEVDFDAALLDDGMHTVTLIVTDDKGASHSTTTVVTVLNAAPTANFTVGGSLVMKQNTSFDGSFADPGLLDTHTVRWNFGDGTVIECRSVEEAGALNVQHSYKKHGTYTVTMELVDDDGAAVAFSTTITITQPGRSKPSSEESRLECKRDDASRIVEERRLRWEEAFSKRQEEKARKQEERREKKEARQAKKYSLAELFNKNVKIRKAA